MAISHRQRGTLCGRRHLRQLNFFSFGMKRADRIDWFNSWRFRLRIWWRQSKTMHALCVSLSLAQSLRGPGLFWTSPSLWMLPERRSFETGRGSSRWAYWSFRKSRSERQSALILAVASILAYYTTLSGSLHFAPLFICCFFSVPPVSLFFRGFFMARNRCFISPNFPYLFA